VPPSLSVVVPSLDSPWLGETLAALAATGAPSPTAEVLVVGCDRQGRVPRDGSIHFLESPIPLSPAAARNRGVAAARGEKILFTDADCRPRPGWIASLSTALDTAPVAGGAVTFSLTADSWAVADNIASFHELLTDRPAEADTAGPLGSLNLAVTRSAWDRVGPFDEALVTSEDVDWVLRARAAGLATAFVPEALVEHAPVRRDRRELVAHATWYGTHFEAFRRRHPGVFDAGPTWRSRRRLAAAAPLKAVSSATAIFLRHPTLPWRFLPGVVVFKRAWYRAVLAGWAAAEAP